MTGVLNIDKPGGITSHDVVSHVRKHTNQRRVGHAGTLDPFATGVLIVAVGSATRLIEYTRDLPKTYHTTFTLGAKSDTDDRTGEITPSNKTSHPTITDIKTSLQKFVGTIKQTPPDYAALKVQGKKMYELARAGKDIHAKPRNVTVHAIKFLHYNYPQLKLEITCGSGTYIRAIARDLGQKLNTNAYVQELRRTAIGDFTLDTAMPLSDLTKDNIAEHLLSPKTLIAHMPKIELDKSQTIDFRQGKTITIQPQANIVAVYDTNQNLIGIGENKENALQPKKVLPELTATSLENI